MYWRMKHHNIIAALALLVLGVYVSSSYAYRSSYAYACRWLGLTK